MDHLFKAGLTKGGPGVMQGPYGSIWVMSYGLAISGGSPCQPSVATPPVAPKALNYIVFQNLPAAIAQDIDTKFDDGVFNTGTVLASSAYTGAGVPDVVACFAMPMF